VGLCAAALAAPPAPKADPCKGIKNCITVPGPWVAVPAHGEANFLLECPKRQGTVGGYDGLATSTDVRVTWDAYLGAPIKAGTASSSPFGFFRAVSAGGRPGEFQPYIGCIPPPKANPRVTTSARLVRAAALTAPGRPLDRWQTKVLLRAGAHQAGSRACGKGERLVSGWQATAFASDDPTAPALASKVHVDLRTGDGRMLVAIRTDAGLPATAKAEVQVGAVCAK
jgi:hypothetical protein